MTVTVERVVPSAVTPLEGDPEIVEFATTGAPATKVTEVVTPLKPAGVAILTVFVSAIVDFRVAVACPEASVVEPGWAIVFPIPVAAIVVETPLTRLLFASRRVIVTVEEVVPSAVTPLEGEAEMLEFAANGAPATKATVAVTPVKPLGVAMLTVLVSATVVAIVPVAMPEAFVVEAGWVSVFPVPVDENVVEIPLTVLLKASRRVIVTVEVVEPSALTPELGDVAIVEFTATGAPAVKVTVPSFLVTGEVICSVFTSARVEVNVQVETPEASEEEQVP